MKCARSNAAEKTIALILLAAQCSSGCGPARIPDEGTYTKRYNGGSMHYEIEAKEQYVSNVCVVREIILRAPNRTNSPGIVGYARLTDRECNDSIDDVFFRDPLDARRVTFTHLEQDAINAFYEVRGSK